MNINMPHFLKEYITFLVLQNVIYHAFPRTSNGNKYLQILIKKRLLATQYIVHISIRSQILYWHNVEMITVL